MSNYQELYKKYRMSCNAKYKNYYILKCDISKFFYSINKEILYEIIKRYVKDYKYVRFLQKILDKHMYSC